MNLTLFNLKGSMDRMQYSPITPVINLNPKMNDHYHKNDLNETAMNGNNRPKNFFT